MTVVVLPLAAKQLFFWWDFRRFHYIMETRSSVLGVNE
ncbi:hypothetical protein GS8_1230 [Geobacillus stearothermophilus]|uniref:EXS domain-containing protein n=1 Tax=Geobacillus stearothermophilus TaxID=1422 RepID=A0ABQ7HHJ4_GEOSE|nr:hypothetical protein GS8_1230 [Geobacillus stearothermophilus]